VGLIGLQEAAKVRATPSLTPRSSNELAGSSFRPPRSSTATASSYPRWRQGIPFRPSILSATSRLRRSDQQWSQPCGGLSPGRHFRRPSTERREAGGSACRAADPVRARTLKPDLGKRAPGCRHQPGNWDPAILAITTQTSPARPSASGTVAAVTSALPTRCMSSETWPA